MFSKKLESGTAAPAGKPKLKLRRRQIKKALVVTFYSFVVVATIIGMVAPGLTF